jgi:hypothetical protein
MGVKITIMAGYDVTAKQFPLCPASHSLWKIRQLNPISPRISTGDTPPLTVSSIIYRLGESKFFFIFTLPGNFLRNLFVNFSMLFLCANCKKQA